MLQGEFHHTVDAKGRFFFPTQLREEIGNDPVICRGYEKNLMIFSREEWNRFADKIASLPLRDSRAMTLRFITRSGPAAVDAQGRMLVPQQMREFAGISKNIVIAGAQNAIELWDEAAWNAKMELLDEEDALSVFERNGL